MEDTKQTTTPEEPLDSEELKTLDLLKNDADQSAPAEEITFEKLVKKINS